MGLLCREYDIQRARELAQDPRPLEEKQRELLQVCIQYWERATICQTVCLRAVILTQHTHVHVPHAERACLLLTVQELEDLVVEFLEKGATIEQDVLANLKALLPEQVWASRS